MRLLLNFETTAPQHPSKDGGGGAKCAPPRPSETAEGAAPDRVKLAKNVDEDSPVKHWLAVHRRDQVGNFLFGGGVDIIV